MAKASGTLHHTEKMNGLTPETRRKQENIAFEMFGFLMNATAYGHLKKAEMIEVVDFMKEEAPDMKFHHGFKQFFWNYLFRKEPHAFIYMLLLK